MRTVLQFRLAFGDDAGHQRSRGAPAEPAESPAERRPRPFSTERPPSPPTEAPEPANPEETEAKREKARQGHHDLLTALHRTLTATGCRGIEEIPAAIDLWATRPDGRRVIFEAKTLTGVNELHQTRAGFAQLLEYRVEYGAPADELCLVVDQPLTVRRQKLLDSIDVGVLVRSDADFTAGNDEGTRLIERLTDPHAGA